MTNPLRYFMPNGGGVLVRTGSSELGMQAEIGQRNLSYRDNCAKLVSLPTTVSAETVTEMAGFAENAQATAGLLQQQSREQIKAANALVSMHETNNSHAVAMARLNNRAQQSDRRYAQGMTQYKLQTKIANVQLTGFQQAYEGSMSAMRGW